MKGFATIPDGPRASGRVRYDRRPGPAQPRGPALVLLGGLTQTVSSWSSQLRPLATGRETIAYEARGQGATELGLEDCSPRRHVEDFAALLDALDVADPVDLCGFSFGGRISLAIAATRPALVRRLVLSGVGLDRGVLSRVIVRGWIASLATGDLEALARVTLADIVGPAYLERNAGLIDSMVAAAVARNRFEAVEALFRDTQAIPEDSPWALHRLVRNVRCPALVLGGGHDRLASPADTAALAWRIGARHRTFDGCGHTIPIEAATAWRSEVEGFLDA